MNRPDWFPSWAAHGVRCACISDFWQSHGIDGPANGQVVTISEIYQNAAGFVTFRFREHYGWFDENTGTSHGYNARNFRPLASRKADEAMFRELTRVAGDQQNKAMEGA